MVGMQVVSVQSHGDDLEHEMVLKAAEQNIYSFSTPQSVPQAVFIHSRILAVTRT
jgi:hypothetical protein